MALLINKEWNVTNSCNVSKSIYIYIYRVLIVLCVYMDIMYMDFELYL